MQDSFEKKLKDKFDKLNVDYDRSSELDCMKEHPDQLTYRPTRKADKGFGLCYAVKEGGHYNIYGVEDTLISKFESFGQEVKLFTPTYYGSLCSQEKEAVAYFLNRLNSNLLWEGVLKSYVYFATVDGEIKYIGKGEAGRWKHCISGTSHLRKLNKDLFEGKEICVYMVKAGMTSDEALRLESDLISSFSCHQGIESLYNTQGVASKKYPTYISEESLKQASRLLGKYVEYVEEKD